MNNKDTILKYLSDLMDDKEKREFEDELKNNSVLKEEYDKYSRGISNFVEDTQVEEDSAYFNNLVPKIKAKLDKKKKSRTYIFAPVLSFGIAVLMLLLLSFPSNKNYSSIDDYADLDISEALAGTDNEELEDLFERNFISDYTFYHTGDFTSNFEITDEELFYDNIQLDEKYPEYDYELYEDISDSEADIIYEELINKNIL